MVSSVIYDMITTNMIVNELCAFAMVVFADGTKNPPKTVAYLSST